MNIDDIVNKFLDDAENGAELHFINISIPPRNSGTPHKNNTQRKRRQSEKKALRRNRKK